MIRLKERITKNGHEYFLVQRTEKKALYAQYCNGLHIGYELFRIRIQRRRFSHYLNRLIPARERFPCNEDFGKSAWSVRTFEKALLKYNSL